MEVNWQKHTSQTPDVINGLTAIDVGRAHERYEYHLQRLVDLGAVTQQEYVCRYLLVPSDEARHFHKTLASSQAPTHIDFTYDYPAAPEPMRLTVWCYPEHAEAWDAFIADHDVPDYRDRFMPSSDR